MAFGAGRGGAPGTFIYEGAIANTANVASFNTTYMMVDAPDTSLVTRFPYNRPIAISSLNEYENLIGTLPTTGGPELTSYYSVKAFFQQAAVADLRVTRVGTPSVIQNLAFNPGANKDDGVNAPSALQKGDLVYIKLLVNGVELGETNAAGAWVGVPVTIPANYIPGDITNNLQISTAMRDAAKVAIEANADINAGAYIRETGVGSPACTECAWLDITGRVFNSQVELINSNSRTGNQFIFASNAYAITNVSESAQTVYDWIQCVRSAFDDPKLPQGYLTAPAAFTIYDQQGRVNLGQSMEEVCSDPNHKWMALVDCGPFYVTSIEKYKDYKEADVAEGFELGGKYLVDNVIYEWTDTDPLNFTEANYDAASAGNSANSALADGDRRALEDDRIIRSSTVASTAANVVVLDTAWPADLPSGEIVEVSLFINEPTPIAPTYNDVYTGVTGAPLIGTFYAIAPATSGTIDTGLKLATSRTRALANQGIDIITAGTPNGGGMLVLKYATASWGFDVTLRGQTSNVIEVNNNNGASFNTKHLPATLQKPTNEFDFRATVRQLTDPSQSIFVGGVTTKYFNQASVVTATSSITVPAHSYSTGDPVNLYQVPSALVPAGLTSGTTYYVIKTDDNTIQLAATAVDAQAGTNITITGTGTDSATVDSPLGANAQSVLTQGGDIMVFSADHGLSTSEKIFFSGSIGNATSNQVVGSTNLTQTLYYVKRDDRNLFRLAPSSSDLAAGVFIDAPASVITTTAVTRFYRALSTATPASSFSDAGILRYVRGRKYQMDVTLSVFNVKDESGFGVQSGANNPYGVAYTADVSTDFRISSIQNPVGVAEYSVNAAAIGTTSDSITITDHGYTVGQALTIGTAVGATLAAGLNENTQYFAIVPSADTLKFATSVANAGAGTAVDITTTGTDNTAGVQFLVAKDSSPFTFTYTEDTNAVPLNNARDFAGGNNFYCTPLSTGDQPNAGLEEIFAMVVVQEGNTRTTAYGSSVEIEFVEPSTEVPDGLFNFDAVTGAVVMSEALRGVNNNGNPQVVVVEKGMDDHSNLFAESQKYSTTQGFLAYYAPYLLNDLGVYVPPTGFVTGFAMKRYRDEIAGFRLPPAGAKYAVAGARGVQVEITTGMQDVSNPYGLNALRQLPGYSETDPDTGITYGPIFIWGSRTRVNPANAEQALYKFVNTRVILNVIYGTLENALDNQIFNIIDGRAVTFNQIRTLVSNTLYSNFYVPGALFGAGAADAFDVVVDDRNNPAANLDNGLVNVQIFVVPVPTLERIEIDLLRVSIGGIKTAQVNLGY